LQKHENFLLLKEGIKMWVICPGDLEVTHVRLCYDLLSVLEEYAASISRVEALVVVATGAGCT
jgi:hypothetical protein